MNYIEQASNDSHAYKEDKKKSLKSINVNDQMTSNRARKSRVTPDKEDTGN